MRDMLFVLYKGPVQCPSWNKAIGNIKFLGFQNTFY